jgi:hypothetical protein
VTDLVPHGGPIGRADVLRRRDELARELAELQFDLGGLAYEMAVRDHWRLDVLVRRAARLSGGRRPAGGHRAARPHRRRRGRRDLSRLWCLVCSRRVVLLSLRGGVDGDLNLKLSFSLY